jgi:dipeptidase
MRNMPFFGRPIRALGLLVIAVLMFLFATSQTFACTTILITPGASADGSAIIAYACDLAGQYNELPIIPAADHKPGEMIEIPSADPKDKRPPIKIPQVPHTYKLLGYMNEHQLVIGETTFGGREQLINPQAYMLSRPLMIYALQRATTAREAIKVMTQLAEKYGFADTGESFSIGDTREAWILEMVGTGVGGHGAIWAAVRVPDGQVSCTANTARIREIDRSDPGNCLYSENVQSYAESHGWYDPKSGEPFRFSDAYFPVTPVQRRIGDTRIWSILRRVAPSKHLSPDYHRLSKPANETVPYPLWLPPDAKLTLPAVLALMRDHYEGTEYDMTQGIDAGPYGLPARWRPLAWKVDGVDYVWERPISTQQTAFSFIAQSRSWLPDSIGGVYWYGVDDTFTSCYMPFYCCVEAVPKCFTTGANSKFSLDSAWWTFNLVSNYAYLKWSMMVPEIQACQKDLESNFLALQPAVEKTALELSKTSPNLMTRYLSDYSTMHAEQTVARWRELAEHLIVKYNDGYVRDVNGQYPEVGYPEAWLRRVLRERPEQFKVPPEKPPEKK